MPKIKTIARQEPLEWLKNTIRRQKPEKTVKKTEYGRREQWMHSSRQTLPINGPDLINNHNRHLQTVDIGA